MIAKAGASVAEGGDDDRHHDDRSRGDFFSPEFSLDRGL